MPPGFERERVVLVAIVPAYPATAVASAHAATRRLRAAADRGFFTGVVISARPERRSAKASRRLPQ